MKKILFVLFAVAGLSFITACTHQPSKTKNDDTKLINNTWYYFEGEPAEKMFVYNSKYKFNANGTADILMNYGEGTEYYTTQNYTATWSYNEGKLSVSNVTISPSDTEVDSSALFINFPKAAEIAENPVTILDDVFYVTNEGKANTVFVKDSLPVFTVPEASKLKDSTWSGTSQTIAYHYTHTFTFDKKDNFTYELKSYSSSDESVIYYKGTWSLEGNTFKFTATQMGDTLSEMKDLQEPITSTFYMDYSKNIIKLEISENETSYLIRQ